MTIRNKSTYTDLKARIGSNYEIDEEEPVTWKETLAGIVVMLVITILAVEGIMAIIF